MVVISFCLVRSSTCLCLVLSMLLVRWLRQSIQNLELEPAIAANQYYNCGASGGSSLGALMVLLYSTWNQINQGTWPSSCISNELQAIGTKLKFSNTLFTKWTQHKVCIINAMIPKIYGGAAVTAQTCPLFTRPLICMVAQLQMHCLVWLIRIQWRVLYVKV